jgi:hypothetical protein
LFFGRKICKAGREKVGKCKRKGRKGKQAEKSEVKGQNKCKIGKNKG